MIYLPNFCLIVFFLLITGLFLYLYFLNIGLNFTFLQSYFIFKSSFLFSRCSIFIIPHFYHGYNMFSYFEVFSHCLFPLFLFFVFVFYTERFLQIYDELCLFIFNIEALKAHWKFHIPGWILSMGGPQWVVIGVSLSFLQGNLQYQYL